MRELPWNETQPQMMWFDGVGTKKRRGVHVFDATSVDAVNAALAADRPLLVRGEPGSGKSQLARAAAAGLGRPFVSMVIDARTEAADLMYSFDTVSRLAKAQILPALGINTRPEAETELREEKFLTPRPLWWAFDWKGAAKRAEPPPQSEGADPGRGVVVLLDEIDKADPSLPNGLLEALGQRQFSCPGGITVHSQGAEPPLVIITTNEERALPDPFLRRCLVLHLGLPEKDDDLKAELVVRGKAHFPRAPKAVLDRVADLLIKDRAEARSRELAPPGCAEYLDLLRAVTRLRRGKADQMEMLGRIAGFALKKHAPEPGR